MQPRKEQLTLVESGIYGRWEGVFRLTSWWLIEISALCVGQRVKAAVSQNPTILELVWDAPPQCPPADAVQESIRSLVGSGAVRSDQLRAEGRIVKIDEKFYLTLLVRSGAAAGIRKLESDSCEDLTGAAAVGLGLLIRLARANAAPLTSEALGGTPADAEQSDATPNIDRHPNGADSLSGGEPLPVPANIPVEHPSVSSHPTSPKLPGASSQRGRQLVLRLPSLQLGFFTLPGLSLGYAAAVGAKYQRWEGFFTGTYFPQRRVESQRPALGVNVARHSLHLEACHVTRHGSFEGAPCLSAALTQTVASGTGEGLVSVRSTVLMWSAGTTIYGRLYWADWAALYLAATGELQTPRPRFVNTEVGDLYRCPWIGLQLGLGTEWHF